eukprot:scaffold2509_cov169-Amphora_coffeaeformis.AAC.9
MSFLSFRLAIRGGVPVNALFIFYGDSLRGARWVANHYLLHSRRTRNANEVNWEIWFVFAFFRKLGMLKHAHSGADIPNPNIFVRPHGWSSDICVWKIKNDRSSCYGISPQEMLNTREGALRTKSLAVRRLFHFAVSHGHEKPMTGKPRVQNTNSQYDIHAQKEHESLQNLESKRY